MKVSIVLEVLARNGCPSDLRSSNLIDDFDCVGNDDFTKCINCWKTALEESEA